MHQAFPLRLTCRVILPSGYAQPLLHRHMRHNQHPDEDLLPMLQAAPPPRLTPDGGKRVPQFDNKVKPRGTGCACLPL